MYSAITALLVTLLLRVPSGFCDPVEIDPAIDYDVVVFRTGDDPKVAEYRIPVLAVGPINNTLVLVVEARLNGKGDDTFKNIAYKYSEDAGLTWSDEIVLFASPNNYNVYAGSMVVDQFTKSMIFIMPYCELPCPGGKYNTSNIWTTYQYTSLDDGKTWSEPRNISDMIGTKCFGGPNTGVQKQLEPNVGRLVSCSHLFPLSTDGIWCITSDDHGETWQSGLFLMGLPYDMDKVDGDLLPDENNVVELSNGWLLINARNQYHFHCRCRLSIYSENGDAVAARSQDITVNTDLPDSAVASGLATYQGTVLYAAANSSTAREFLAMRWSYDSGATWTPGIMLWPAGCGYASMAAQFEYDPRSENRKVYIAYEKGIVVGTIDSISVATVDLFGAYD